MDLKSLYARTQPCRRCIQQKPTARLPVAIPMLEAEGVSGVNCDGWHC